MNQYQLNPLDLNMSLLSLHHTAGSEAAAKRFMCPCVGVHSFRLAQGRINKWKGEDEFRPQEGVLQRGRPYDLILKFTHHESDQSCGEMAKLPGHGHAIDIPYYLDLRHAWRVDGALLQAPLASCNGC